MTWEQLSLFENEDPKKIEKTVAIQLQELREQIAQELEAMPVLDMQQVLAVVRGQQ